MVYREWDLKALGGHYSAKYSRLDMKLDFPSHGVWAVLAVSPGQQSSCVSICGHFLNGAFCFLQAPCPFLL